MSEISPNSNSPVVFSPCVVQKKTVSETRPQLNISNPRGLADSITIHGYSELFALSPSIKVYKDGRFCGQVAPHGRFKMALDNDCNLKFKSMFRSAEVSVKKGEDTHIFLWFNRLTGKLNAWKSRDDNWEEVCFNKERAALKATRIVIVLFVLFVVIPNLCGLLCYYFFVK